MSDTPQIMSGPPANTKPSGGRRVDFKVNQFDLQVATKGYRVWWSRAGHCPCQNNPITKQPDPNCTLCLGKGWFNFLPDPRLKDGELDAAGNIIELNEAGTAVATQAVIGSSTNDPQIFEKFGEWYFGTARATTFSLNALGYRDRLECRDATMRFGQLITADGGTTIQAVGEQSEAGLWSPVVDVIMLRSISAEYSEGEHFRITDDGEIEWIITPPASGTMLSLYGTFHPTWVVVEFTYAYRDTLVAQKKAGASLAEQHTRMPMSAMVKLDFLA
jgi:hypothetical protein